MTMSKRDQEPSLAALRHFFDTLVIRPPAKHWSASSTAESHPHTIRPHDPHHGLT